MPLLACVLVMTFGVAADAQTVVVKAARLIDGRGGPPLEPAMVRISGDRIEEVSTSLAVPPGATVIDLGAATLLPGLIDLHTHLTSREGVHWETALTTTTPPEAALWGARNAKAVRTNLKFGADFIKILATGAVLSKGISPGAQQYSDAEIKAAVTEAARWGRQVAAHAHGAEGIKAAIRAGVRTVDHGSYLDAEGVAMLQSSNRSTFYVPTLALYAYLQQSAQVPDSEKARGRTVNEVAVAGFKRALAAGLPIGLATDAPVMPHGLIAREIAYRAELGEPAMRAIVSATSLNAEIMGWQDRVGAVTPGKLADVIAVNGNPLTDISTLQHVRFVMKGGTVYRNEPPKSAAAPR